MMLDLGFLIVLAVAATGLGLRALAGLGLVPEHPADAWALATPLGLGALALAGLGLGVAGLLTPAGLGLVLAAALAVGGRGGWSGTIGAARSLRAGRGIGLGFDVPLAVAVVGSLLTSLAPVTDGDALCYHLQVPKVFLLAHSATFEPDLHETIYPLATEMLYAVRPGLAGAGGVPAGAVAARPGLRGERGGLARPVLGDRARWAGAVALLVPAVSNGMGAPLNDVALAAFGNAAIVAGVGWRGRPSLRAAVLAGLLPGWRSG